MARILIADTPSGAVALNRILSGHECLAVTTMREAETALKAQSFDLIVAGLQFDDSQMFELIREVRKNKKNFDKPIICFSSAVTPISLLMHQSLEFTTIALGAWIYLAEHSYHGHANPDAEIRQIMDHCLTQESRMEIQKRRLDIHKQRLENKQLRMLLQEQEWSPELEEYFDCMKDELESLQKEVAKLRSSAGAQSTTHELLQGLKDKNAEHVKTEDNKLAGAEKIQSSNETMLSAEEDELAAMEQGQLTQRKEASRGE